MIILVTEYSESDPRDEFTFLCNMDELNLNDEAQAEYYSKVMQSVLQNKYIRTTREVSYMKNNIFSLKDDGFPCQVDGKAVLIIE